MRRGVAVRRRHVGRTLVMGRGHRLKPEKARRSHPCRSPLAFLLQILLVRLGLWRLTRASWCWLSLGGGRVDFCTKSTEALENVATHIVIDQVVLMKVDPDVFGPVSCFQVLMHSGRLLMICFGNYPLVSAQYTAAMAHHRCGDNLDTQTQGFVFPYCIEQLGYSSLNL